MKAKIAIIMGSISDHKTIQHTEKVFKEFGLEYVSKVVSAHRTPGLMVDFAKKAEKEGFEIIIAAAGGAAHLPGMVASMTNLPVIGVPIKSRVLNGVDSLLSIAQMPYGVPVATMAIGEAGAKNAALFAIRTLSLNNPQLKEKLNQFISDQTQKVLNTKVK